MKKKVITMLLATSIAVVAASTLTGCMEVSTSTSSTSELKEDEKAAIKMDITQDMVKEDNNMSPEDKANYESAQKCLAYMGAFNDSDISDASAMADYLQTTNSEIKLNKTEVKPGVLEGYPNEVQNFEKGYCLSGTLNGGKFIIYVLQTNSYTDAMELIMSLNSQERTSTWNKGKGATHSGQSANEKLVMSFLYGDEEQ